MPLKSLLQKNLTQVRDLREPLALDAAHVRDLEKIARRFPFSIPPYYLSLVDPADPHDPIRKMCVPDREEWDPDGRFDTSGEGANTILDGLQHKYRQTALILTTSACAMYCRHCFRKRMVGPEEQKGRQAQGACDKILDYIRQHTEINNVLLSGGDALLTPAAVLREYLEALCGMEHLDAVRICTRTPVVLPMRIYEDRQLLRMLSEYGRRKRLYVVTQFNHPREMTKEAHRALEALNRCGLIVRNQTVLLRGVNDDAKIMGDLLRRLIRVGVMPYYLFQCRPVTGVKNRFQIPIARACSLVEQARQSQNGLGKAFRYILSHETGKIEILGPAGNERWLFKYHQAKACEDQGRMFLVKLQAEQCWLHGEDLHAA
ncbi:KamA family radical SAM protein [Desulfovibrio sp. ZJ369]|uniref:KamA family radical SAM protein n=1 Tax=Desulfovibrio sp. ZJ369 TaxID=2709793 RepID=UPI0013EAAD2E|nr:KamA family radical SAM protein [Desulfovibrio sp. ZJ369]